SRVILVWKPVFRRQEGIGRHTRRFVALRRRYGWAATHSTFQLVSAAASVCSRPLRDDKGATTEDENKMVNRLARSFNCPTEFTLQVLGGKWKTVILCYLKMGPFRYAELRKLIPNLSDKVLSQRLRELTEAGL